MKKIITILITVILIITAAVMVKSGRGSVGNDFIGASYDFTDSPLYGTALPVCFREKYVYAYIGMVSISVTHSDRFYTETMEQIPSTLEISLEYGDGLKWISLNFGA